MQCQQVMKENPKCLSEKDTAQSASKLMRDLNVGFIPICSDGGKVVGTVTDRDIVIRVAADNAALTTPLNNVMSRDVLTCKAQDDLSRAESLMEQNKKSRIICVDDRGRPIGVISLSDIAQHEEAARLSKLMRAVTSREVRA